MADLILAGRRPGAGRPLLYCPVLRAFLWSNSQLDSVPQMHAGYIGMCASGAGDGVAGIVWAFSPSSSPGYFVTPTASGAALSAHVQSGGQTTLWQAGRGCWRCTGFGDIARANMRDEPVICQSG